MNIGEKREREKLLGTIKLGRTEQIVVSHLTIRQSIFFLILKLFLIEVLAALCLIFFLDLVYPSSIVADYKLGSFMIPTFIFFVILKTFFTFFIIIQWLEEYYEVTPQEIRHRNGFIFKKEDSYKLEHVGSIELEQGILGRIFNYGTLKLYNWALERNFYLYLIHNPLKYHKVLETLLPEADTGKKVFRQKVVEMEQ